MIFFEKIFQIQIFQKKFFLRKRTFEVLCTNEWGQLVFEIVRRKVPFKKKKKKRSDFGFILHGIPGSFAIRPSTFFAFSYSVTRTFCHEDAFLQLDSYKKCRNDWMQKNTENQIHKKQNISEKSSRKIVPLFLMSSKPEKLSTFQKWS